MAVAKVWDAGTSTWIEVGGGSVVAYQPVAPNTPKIGELWIDSDEQLSYNPLLVAEQTVTGSAVTTMTFTGLDGDAHGGYEVVINLKNATASTSTVACYANNLTTAADYYYVYIQNTTTPAVAASYSNTSYVGAIEASAHLSAYANIMTTQDRFFKIKTFASRALTTSMLNGIIDTAKTVALAENLTRLDFTSSVASSIAIGSKISIYRRK